MALQFCRFGIVGALTFVVTTVALYILEPVLGPAKAAVPAYSIGLIANWTLNRTWTFESHRTSKSRQLLQFGLATGPGLLLNTLVYEALLAASATVSRLPVLGVAGGAVAALVVNFCLQRLFVFRADPQVDGL